MKSSNFTLGGRQHPWQTCGRTSPFQRGSESAKSKPSSDTHTQAIKPARIDNKLVFLFSQASSSTFAFCKISAATGRHVGGEEARLVHLAFMNEPSRVRATEYPPVDLSEPSFCLSEQRIAFQVVTLSGLTRLNLALRKVLSLPCVQF